MDCPSCGRTIRVPNPDGDVEPLPDLKLNLKDAKLATALDELVALGQGAAPFEPREPAVVVEPLASDDVVSNANKPEPDAVHEAKTPKPPNVSTVPVGSPPLVAPVPVAVEPQIPAKPIPLEIHDPRKSTTAASIQELALLAGSKPRDPAAEQPVIDLEVELGLAKNRQQHEARPAISTLISWLVTAALLGFFAGFVVGRWDRAQNNSLKPKSDNAAVAPVSNGRVSDPFQEPSKSAAIRGEIMFKTETGELRSDRGARVVLLPETRQGSAKLAVVGFRSADNEADVHVAAAALKALGGDVAVVGDNGSFEVPTLKPGTYRLLALSHFQPRDDQPIDPATKSLLDAYFDKPDQLLGKCRYHVEEIKVQGTQTVKWNYSFERE